MVATPTRRTKRKAQPSVSNDPRTIKGACVKVPSGDRAYVEGLDPEDSNRVRIKYEMVGSFQDPFDSYPLHMLTLVQESPEMKKDDDNVRLGKQLYSELGGDVAALDDELHSAAIATSHPSALEALATEINTLYGQLEEAEEVATSAARSALTFAREMGQKLLQAKKECGHGNWEEWRKQLASPRSGKALPSSTASLYQRIAKRWEEVESAKTLREAVALLKSDRQLLSATTKSATEPQVVADLKKEVVPAEQIEQITHSGWIKTKEGRSLNPMHYEPEQPISVEVAPPHHVPTPAAPRADVAIAGFPAIQKAVWEFLNLNGIEVDEAVVDSAADSIYEFLHSEFLEVED